MRLRSLEAAPVFADFRKPSQLSADVGDETPRLCLCDTTRRRLEIAFGVAGAVLVGAHARQMAIEICCRRQGQYSGAAFRRRICIFFSRHSTWGRSIFILPGSRNA